jgi:tRNA(Ile)-lysidine synthase
MLKSLEIRVRETILEQGMLTGAEHVLVAVSGGADSIALLFCLHNLSSDLHLSLTVAHLNHRIRGAEGDADEDFVRKICAGLQLPLISETIDIKQQAQSEKRNVEELARQRRYDFLHRTAHRIGTQKIAVGHTLNDQAETAIFRFLRGSGMEGLSAIFPIVDGIVIRPLIECSRSTILDYLEQSGVPFREDSTNKDLQHARNRIRRELLPYLERHFNPRLVETLARETQLIRETWSFISGRAKEIFADLHSRSDNSISIDIKDFLLVHPALQKEVLREALRECLGSLRGITSVHVGRILSLCRTEQSGAMVQLPRGGLAMRQFDAVVLLKQPPPQGVSFHHELKIPGRCIVPEIGLAFISSHCSAPDPKTMTEKRSTQAFFEPSNLPVSLTIRSRKPGDRYGGQGHRKTKKMLIDSRIPLPQRAVLPMIVSGNDVIWIPGFRPARNYAARPGSMDCVAIRMEQIRS